MRCAVLASLMRGLTRGLRCASGVALCLIVVEACCSGQTTNDIAAISAELRSQDFSGALRLTEAALKNNPGDVRLLTLRGLAYSGENQRAQALAAFKQALHVSPDFLPALEAAAQVSYQDGSSLARPYLLRILAVRPMEPTANAMLAVIEYRAGDCNAAVQHFQNAWALLSSQPSSLVEYGACLGRMNRIQEALPIMQEAFDLEPADPVARYNLALAQFSLNQYDDALATLGPLMDGASAPEDVLTLAADIYEAKNETQRAVSILRQAILDHPRDKAAYLDFAYLSYKHSSVKVGIDMLNIGLTQLPNEAELYLARGVLLSQSSNSSEATEDFDMALRLDPHLSFAIDAKGLAASQAHKDVAALAAFRSAAKQHPNDGLTQYLLAEALSEAAPVPGTPTFVEEMTAAKRAVALDPTRLESRDLLAALYLRLNETDLAVQQSQAALRVDPNDESAIYHEILALRKGDRKSEVPALVQRMMKIREAKVDAVKPNVYRLVEGDVPAGAAQSK